MLTGFTRHLTVTKKSNMFNGHILNHTSLFKQCHSATKGPWILQSQAIQEQMRGEFDVISAVSAPQQVGWHTQAGHGPVLAARPRWARVCVSSSAMLRPYCTFHIVCVRVCVCACVCLCVCVLSATALKAGVRVDPAHKKIKFCGAFFVTGHRTETRHAVK